MTLDSSDSPPYQAASSRETIIPGKFHLVNPTESPDRELPGEESSNSILVEGLYKVVAFMDTLIACPSIDEVCRLAVEFVVKELEMERCSIFIDDDGVTMRGTYGVNLRGEIVSEADGRITMSRDLRALFVGENLSDRLWNVTRGSHTEWASCTYQGSGAGWVATTPIHSARRLLGVLFNDCAISGNDVNPARQQVLAVFCSSLGNIMARKRAEQALRSSEERLSSILRDMQEVLWSLDAERCEPVFLSPHVETVFGRHLYEFFEEPGLWLDIIHPDDKDDAARFYQQLKSGVRASVQYRVLRPDGEERWLSLSGRHIRNAEDQGHLLEGIAGDVTERRKVESETRLMVRRNESLIKALGEIVYEHEIESGEIEWEGATLRTLGYQPEEMGNDVNGWLRRVHADDRERVLEHLNWSFENGAPYDAQYRMQTRAGDYRWFHDRGVPLFTREGKRDRIIGVMADVHERREAEERRERLKQRMKEAEKAESLGLLAGGVAHDLNNLVGGILGNLSFAMEDLGEAKESQRALQSLQMVKRTGERAGVLARQLLVFAGKGPSSFTRVHLSTIAADTLEVLRPSLGRDVELQAVLSEDMEAIRADSGQVREIVVNLVSNANDAVTAMGGGEIIVRTGTTRINPLVATEVFIGSELNAGIYAYLEIGDNGGGIPEDVKARIFDPFFTTKRNSRGLGLAAVLGIARSHGGAVSVRSEAGRYTRFTVLLPIEVTQTAKGNPSTPTMTPKLPPRPIV